MSKLPKEENRVSGLWGSRLCYWLWKVLEYFWRIIITLVATGIVGILLVDGKQLPKLLVGILWNEWIIPHRFLAVSIFLGLIVLTVLCWAGSQKYVLYRSLPATLASEKLEEPVESTIHSEDRSKSSMKLLDAMYKKLSSSMRWMSMCFSVGLAVAISSSIPSCGNTLPMPKETNFLFRLPVLSMGKVQVARSSSEGTES